MCVCLSARDSARLTLELPVSQRGRCCAAGSQAAGASHLNACWPCSLPRHLLLQVLEVCTAEIASAPLPEAIQYSCSDCETQEHAMMQINAHRMPQSAPVALKRRICSCLPSSTVSR